MVVGETDPQLTLKTTPPRIPRTMLERARLSSLRPEFADKSVILLQTATGSGKTSLLAQWRKEGHTGQQQPLRARTDRRDAPGKRTEKFRAGLVARRRD